MALLRTLIWRPKLYVWYNFNFHEQTAVGLINYFTKYEPPNEISDSCMCDQQMLRPACAYAQSNQSRIFYDCQATDRISCEVSNVKARLRLHMSKCNIVGIHMSQLKCRLRTILKDFKSTTCLNANSCRKLDSFIMWKMKLTSSLI